MTTAVMMTNMLINANVDAFANWKDSYKIRRLEPRSFAVRTHHCNVTIQAQGKGDA